MAREGISPKVGPELKRRSLTSFFSLIIITSIMPITDLTFNNPNIRLFFEEKTDDPPVGEFMYVHTHVIQDNFLSQLEVLIHTADEILIRNPKKAGVGIRIKSAAERFAKLLGEVDEKIAKNILFELRLIYKLCNVLIASEIKTEPPHPSSSKKERK